MLQTTSRIQNPDGAQNKIVALDYKWHCHFHTLKVKVKWSHYRPGVAQRVGRGIALLFHDRGTRRGWVVSSTPQPHFTPRKDPVPISQEAGWTPGPVWTGRKSRPHQDAIADRTARSQLLYWLSYLAHHFHTVHKQIYNRHVTYKEKHHLIFQFCREVVSNQARVRIRMFRDIGHQRGYTQVLIDVTLAPNNCWNKQNICYTQSLWMQYINLYWKTNIHWNC